ncbi:MAG: alcohol dehydrogenase [Arthrobacter sp.]|uniref:alcohol dehydrogenase n=1 Tax=Micrococcales TaxID=85006 RepID=UPI00115D3D1D|nr:MULTISPECIES: alcohol dehydrogenase [Micrococcales]MBA4100707.1 alcohol dehydrogenase [Arthrobacter sp.]MCE7482415.1 alcohol dehydrogenase [Microbacterium profundi]TQS91956.1 alcohol dehydrogenase [Arthrobacter sp. TS-15]BCW06977.1 NAD-dependent alcohol dehydrogenase [Arthrobacter sp. NtRootA1]
MHAFAVLPDDPTIHDLELPTPSPEGRQVILKVVRAGVCHTDTHLREGGYDLGSRGHLSMKDRGIQYPMVLGHEVVGVVEKVGGDVTSVREGDVRLIYPWIGCGECRQCREGHDNRCAAGRNLGVARHGGYADYILVPDEKYLVDIDGIDPSWAATLACSGLTAHSAVDKVLPLEPDEPVVIFGAGGLGLTAIAILRARGHRNICAVDVAERNLTLARDMGATSTVLSGKNSGAGDIQQAIGGPASAVVDFVNNGVTATAAFDVLAKAGTMIQVGLFGGEVTLPTAMLALRMIRIEGSFVGTLSQLQDLVRIAQTGELPTIPVVERTLSAAEVSRALDDLTTGGVAGRIVLTA